MAVAFGASCMAQHWAQRAGLCLTKVSLLCHVHDQPYSCSLAVSVLQQAQWNNAACTRLWCSSYQPQIRGNQKKMEVLEAFNDCPTWVSLPYGFLPWQQGRKWCIHSDPNWGESSAGYSCNSQCSEQLLVLRVTRLSRQHKAWQGSEIWSTPWPYDSGFTVNLSLSLPLAGRKLKLASFPSR